jgi:hypothetical protein
MKWHSPPCFEFISAVCVVKQCKILNNGQTSSPIFNYGCSNFPNNILQHLLLNFNSKKGKKEGKKVKKDTVLKDAVANAKLWETKLTTTEKSRSEFR